ncbi:MAG: PIG-L family deacetylase [Planctomycetaceae bacterium]|nr:PIG-L family deacetylase [Planctomycetaceae bacterium]
MSILFQRRTENGMISSDNPADVWSDWQGQDERWLFVAPHDDDIVIGAGLTFLAGVQLGIETYAAVVSNGRMGYCTPSQRETIMQVRYEETRNSFRFLGLHDGHLYQFDYDDGSLSQQMGRRFADNPNDSRVICGAIGLQNTMVWLLRKVRPTRVFMPNRLDLHPDHSVVNSELVMSVFHAQGQIWPELGLPIPVIPKLYEYATYNDFISPPTMRVHVSDDLAEKRLAGIALYKSQLQIDLVVDEIRKAGGNEYLLETAFKIFSATKYESLF